MYQEIFCLEIMRHKKHNLVFIVILFILASCKFHLGEIYCTQHKDCPADMYCGDEGKCVPLENAVYDLGKIADIENPDTLSYEVEYDETYEDRDNLYDIGYDEIIDVCNPDCSNKKCGDDDGCGGRCIGSCPEGKICNPNTYICENISSCEEGEKQCNGTKVQNCTNGEWVDGEDCAASGRSCENGACTGTPCIKQEGTTCNIDNSPCCTGLSCVTIFQNQKDSKCYMDCTNNQSVCSSNQQCIGWSPNICKPPTYSYTSPLFTVCNIQHNNSVSAACFELTTIANGTFSNCLSYKDGEQPGENDKMGTASIKATIGGISYNFTVCAGDYQVVDQSGNYWLVEIYDVSKLQTKKIVYLFTIFVDEEEHTVSTHTIGEKIQLFIYELSLDANYNIIKAILHSMGIQGDLNFSAVGTGSKAPTTGTISNVLMMGYDYVICDNAAEKPCQ